MINYYKSPFDYQHAFNFLDHWRQDLIDFIKLAEEERESTPNLIDQDEIASEVSYANDQLDEVIAGIHAVRLAFLSDLHKELEKNPL